jgi:hypothetical protein
MEYFVEVDDPFDTKVYGVMRFVRRDVDALLRTRFDVPTRESILGVDFVVDRFFATTAANEIAGEPDGATFIRTLMLDATRKEAWRMSPCRAVPILSAVPIDVEGVKVFAHSARDVAVVECDGVACDADVMAEREDWVTRKFLTLYVVPASAPNEAKNALSPGKKTWLAFAEARGETLRDDATNDDAPMMNQQAPSWTRSGARFATIPERFRTRWNSNETSREISSMPSSLCAVRTRRQRNAPWCACAPPAMTQIFLWNRWSRPCATRRRMPACSSLDARLTAIT